MKKILEEFWFGNIRPFEQVAPPPTPLNNQAMDARNILINSLSEEQKECFEAYEAAFDTLNMEASKNAFIFGFQIGAKFMEAIENS